MKSILTIVGMLVMIGPVLVSCDEGERIEECIEEWDCCDPGEDDACCDSLHCVEIGDEWRCSFPTNYIREPGQTCSAKSKGEQIMLLCRGGYYCDCFDQGEDDVHDFLDPDDQICLCTPYETFGDDWEWEDDTD